MKNKVLYIIITTLVITVGLGIYFKKNIFRTSISTTNILKLSDIQSYIETTLNLKTNFFEEEGVIKISIPRNEIPFSINDVTLDPFMGTTTWARSRAIRGWLPHISSY